MYSMGATRTRMTKRRYTNRKRLGKWFFVSSTLTFRHLETANEDGKWVAFCELTYFFVVVYDGVYRNTSSTLLVHILVSTGYASIRYPSIEGQKWVLTCEGKFANEIWSVYGRVNSLLTLAIREIFFYILYYIILYLHILYRTIR